MFTHLVNCKVCDKVTENLVPVHHRDTKGNLFFKANVSQPPVCLECLPVDKKRLIKTLLKQIENTIFDEDSNSTESTAL